MERGVGSRTELFWNRPLRGKKEGQQINREYGIAEIKSVRDRPVCFISVVGGTGHPRISPVRILNLIEKNDMMNSQIGKD